jgi:CBS domain-containing protein
MTRVKDIMTTSPAFCTADTPLQEVARMMVDCDCGAIPVVDDVDGRRPIGMVTDRDITVRAVASGRNPMALTARDCMTTPVATCRDDARLDDCIDLLETKQLRRVPIVDAAGALCGIVAQADVAEHASKRKAGELVRKISEHAPKYPGPDGVRPDISHARGL